MTTADNQPSPADNPTCPLAVHEALSQWEEGYFAQRHATLEPLVIRLTLRQGSPLVSYDPVQLDNLLAFAVVQEATQGRMVGDPPPPCVGWQIPLPLRRAWTSEQGLPLWESTVFWPVPGVSESAAGDVVSVGDVLYWHKRMPRGMWSTGGKSGKLSLNGSTGRFMERRTPVPVTLCTHWEARCVGDRAEVSRLLSSVAFVGKKRAIGLGEVARWDVSPTTDAAVIVRDKVLQRPIPNLFAEQAGLTLAEAPARVGWTPPQWNPKLFAEGWQPGSRLA